MGDAGGTRRSRRSVIAGMLGVGGAALSGRGLRALTNGPARIDDAATGASKVASRLNPPTRQSWVTDSIGTTRQGRPIQIHHSLTTIQRVHVLVIGAIHGNEPVTRPIVDALRWARIPDDMSLSLVPAANPDGWAAGTRRNSRGVDLNRNFPWRWSPATGGPGSGSEIETQALMHYIRSSRPDLVVWVHQPLAYIAPIGGCPWAYADAWVSAAGTRRRTGIDQHGGSETWTAQVAGLDSMLIEVSSWNNTPQMVAAHVAGFEALAQVVGRV